MLTSTIERAAKGEGMRPKDAEQFPSYASFLRSLDTFLAAQSLSPKTHRLAKAFAIAAYRRALARRTNEVVESLVDEAIANALPSSSPPADPAREGKSHFYHIGYAFGSRRSKRQKSRKSGISVS